MKPALTLAALMLAGCGGPPQTDVPPVENPTAPGEFAFEFSNFRSGDPDSVPPVLAEVRVKIIKMDPGAGRVEWRRIHKQGSILGFGWEDEVFTSVHVVTSSARPGRKVPVDFNTGSKIEKIIVDKVVAYAQKRCTILDEPLETCPGPVEIKDIYRVNEVVICKPSGERTVVSQAEWKKPRPNSLCSKHGGHVEAPKWTPLQLREARLDSASNLYLDAENWWKSKNPKVRRQAQENYKKLLALYADLEFVRQNQPRIKERAEGKIED